MNFNFSNKLKSFFKVSELKPEFWEELEEILLSSDVGLPSAQKIIAAAKGSKKIDEVKQKLRDVMSGLLLSHKIEIKERPYVIMVVGVNGTGKTTTIAKLAGRFKKEGKGILLVAGDTFRAAAVEQLKVWSDRLGVALIAQKPDSDPASVVFDGIRSAEAKKFDVVILDTAGRLHTNKNLMEELSKVKRVAAKALPGAPHEIILVMDATVGQNGLAQAREFNDVLGLTGVILAKMDGTAKGGVIFTIADELKLPISFVGTGEGAEDIEEFEPSRFVSGILE